MNQSIWTFAEDKTAQGQKVAWITVTRTHGSSPSSVGQVMVVAEDGQTIGTIGGGASEHGVAQQALQAMRDGERLFTFAVDHATEGMVCGGGMEGIGNILGQDARLIIFGGGHVSQALARLATLTGLHVCVVEDREALATAFEGVAFILSEPDAYAQSVPVGASDYVVICTRGHQSDDEALRYCLGKPCRYLGMIGSRRKVETLLDRLRAEGYAQAEIDRIYAPIGLAIASEKPAEIAVSILAEILLIKNGGTPAHMKDRGLPATQK